MKQNFCSEDCKCFCMLQNSVGLSYLPVLLVCRMDDVQLCKEITRLKKELQKLVSVPGEIWESPDFFFYCTVVKVPSTLPLLRLQIKKH